MQDGESGHGCSSIGFMTYNLSLSHIMAFDANIMTHGHYGPNISANFDSPAYGCTPPTCPQASVSGQLSITSTICAYREAL